MVDSVKILNADIFAHRRQSVTVVLVAIALALVIHLGPNLGIPLHSDTAFMFLIQSSSEPQLAANLPDQFVDFGIAPQNPVSGAIQIGQVAGRYNVLNFVQFWFTAKIAGTNADIWRLIPIVFMGAAVGFFYLTLTRLKTPAAIAIVLSGWILTHPVDAWVNYNKSESFGLFFLALAAWLVASRRGVIPIVAAAFFMSAAVLTKETFAPAWILVIAIQFWNSESRPTIRRVAQELWPHAIGVILIAIIFWAIWATSNTDQGYGTSGGSTLTSNYTFIAALTHNLAPYVLSTKWGALVGILAVAGTTYVAWRNQMDRKRWVILIAAGLAFIAHASIHYSTGRIISGRYVVPANFELAVAYALIASGLISAISLRNLARRTVWIIGITVWMLFVALGGPLFMAAAAVGIGAAIAFALARKKLHIATLTTVVIAASLLLPAIDTALVRASFNRADQIQFWKLVDEVEQSTPRNAVVEFTVPDPNMIETVQAIEAFTLLRGRYDLEFQFFVKPSHAIDTATPYVAKTIADYNSGRELTAGEIGKLKVQIVADRQRNSGPSKSGGSVFQRIKQRYSSDRAPYLNYTVTTELP